jgi:hypothetical protein
MAQVHRLALPLNAVFFEGFLMKRATKHPCP